LVATPICFLLFLKPAEVIVATPPRTARRRDDDCKANPTPSLSVHVCLAILPIRVELSRQVNLMNLLSSIAELGRRDAGSRHPTSSAGASGKIRLILVF
jgi:hypothetical protein